MYYYSTCVLTHQPMPELFVTRKLVYFTEHIVQLESNNPKDMCTTIKRLINKKSQTNVTELNIDGTSTTNTKDIANVFNDYFSNIGRSLSNKLTGENEYIQQHSIEFKFFDGTYGDINFMLSCLILNFLNLRNPTEFLPN